jgi:hypothetical protein
MKKNVYVSTLKKTQVKKFNKDVNDEAVPPPFLLSKLENIVKDDQIKENIRACLSNNRKP